MARRKVATTVYLTAEQDMRLKQVQQRTKVPAAELIRQGVDMVLERYEAQAPGPGWAGVAGTRREKP